MLLEYVIDVCGLNESARILDVGCGLGLFARSLTTFLKDNGRYDGFDVNAKAIAWCRDNIAGGFPRFHFQAIEIGNKLYNPKGTGRASDFVFPYSDDSFDFVLVSSVFTHMFPHEVENYFSEIFRVLKTGGKCLVSFWLLNEESSKLMRGTTPPLDFPYHFQH